MTSASGFSVAKEERERFYAAAVAGLRALDAREPTPRRFGTDADLRWASFKGALNEADRIDILLRDATATWGAGFSPAEVFGLFGLAPDEPLGPDWQSLSPSAARRYVDGGAAISRPSDIGKLMGIRSVDVEVPRLTASTRVAVAGGAALVAVAEVFAEHRELSWSDQVLAIATDPAHRQLAGLLAVFTGAPARTRLARPGDDVRAILKPAGFAQVDLAVTSPDAEPDCAAFANGAAGVA